MANSTDLSDFLTNSLCLGENVTSPARPMFYHKDPLAQFYEENPLKILGEVEFTKSKEIPVDEVGTPIQEFFREANVFITGGSGFLGKLLTEKLVRAMPHIGHIYLLIRPKRGKSCKERFDLLMEDKVFRRMKAEKPHYHTKITALPGDILEPGLGLNSEDRQLLADSVNVVFHCAADVNFFMSLREAVNSNLLGCKRVMDLGREMKKLKAYIHVSTAYSQCVHKVIEERVPSMSINYKDVLHYIETNTDKDIEENLQNTLQGWPNTYTFSKALCEQMIEDEGKGLPISIFRPSIITPTNREPVRGYTDNLYGPTGMLIAVTLGIVHSYKVTKNATSDGVPVDYVTNALLVWAWKMGSMQSFRENDRVQVCNFTSSPQNLLHFGIVIDRLQDTNYWPSSYLIWYPSVIITGNYLWFRMYHFLLNKMPGHVLDNICVMIGKKPRLTKIYNILEKLYETGEYFLLKFWDFKNENMIKMLNSMSLEDKTLFNFDVRDINWVEYITICWIGTRYYYLKESMETLSAAKKKLKWFRVAHICLKAVCGFLALKTAIYVAHVLPI